MTLGKGKPSAALAGLWSQARACYRMGGLAEAQTLCQRILETEFDHPEVLNLLAMILQQRGLLTRAEQVARRAVHHIPRDVAAYNRLGNILIQQKRYEEAITTLRQAVMLGVAEVETYVNLGAVLRDLGRLPEALEAYCQASERRPVDADIQHRLGVILAETGQIEEAIAAQEMALRCDPGHEEAIKQLGTLLHHLGQAKEARAVLGNAVFQLRGRENALAILQHWLRLMPDDPVPQHRLSAWFGQDIPVRASDAYVTDLFDHYADQFDKHLQQLGYRAPTLIGEQLVEALGEASAQLDILDGGCGTGLCEPILRPYARHLTGVDLSPRMVDKARERGGYDELAVAELTAFLNEQPGAYDLIASADTLVYFGALESVLAAATHALRPDGWLAFTVEQTTVDAAPDGYCLNQSGRYSHTAEYLERVLAGAGLEVRTRADATLRQEGNQPVVGHVVLARKPATRDS